jgi:hypothetical protein
MEARSSATRPDATPRVIVWNSHETVKCPVGSLAQHPRWGRVKVVRATGWQRLVEAHRYSKWTTPYGATITFPERFSAFVDVRELRRVDA